MISPMSQSDTFKKAQAEWYEILKRSGFEDIEDHSFEDKPLKRWSGVPALGLIDSLACQEAGAPIQSSFPEKRFIKEERLLNHADFDAICASVCGHGNHKLVASQVRVIWELHLEGETVRRISKTVKINYVTIFRCIVSLTKWSDTISDE